MYQAGVKQITLFERKGVSYYFYDPINVNAITDVVNSGAQIVVENYQLPTFEIEEIKITGQGKTGFDYVVKFYLLDYSSVNKATVQQIKESMHGWAVDIEFYDGTHKFFDVPFRCINAKINPNQEMAFEIELRPAVKSIVEHLDYTPGLTLYTVFTFDSTTVTFDSSIDTFDYEYVP